MAYIATKPDFYLGRVVGSGQCVAYVQQACKAPLTKKWKRGALVRGNKDIKPGTAIATFSKDGVYENKTTGESHAAIYLAQNDKGILVLDQWLKQPVHNRIIREGGVKDVNNALKYYVIE